MLTNCIDRWDVGTEVMIHCDTTALIEFNSNFL